MQIHNVHERDLAASAVQVGRLVESLGAPDDLLWPRVTWPAMRLDRPAAVGAKGGHGPIRYTIEAYDSGRRCRFRFTTPKGFDGVHEFEIIPLGPARTRLRHRIDMQARGLAAVAWLCIFRPLHDALIEDALDNAVRACGNDPSPRRWSPWVRILRAFWQASRWMRRRRRARSPV